MCACACCMHLLPGKNPAQNPDRLRLTTQIWYDDLTELQTPKCLLEFATCTFEDVQLFCSCQCFVYSENECSRARAFESIELYVASCFQVANKQRHYKVIHKHL